MGFLLVHPKTRLTPSLHFFNWFFSSSIFYGGFCCRGISVFCRGISLFLLEHTFCVLSKTRLTSRLQLFQLIFEDTFVRECTVRLGKSWFRVVQVVHWGTTFEGRGGLGPPPPHPPPSACLLFILFLGGTPFFTFFVQFLLKQIKNLTVSNIIIIALN